MCCLACVEDNAKMLACKLNRKCMSYNRINDLRKLWREHWNLYANDKKILFFVVAVAPIHSPYSIAKCEFPFFPRWLLLLRLRERYTPHILINGNSNDNRINNKKIIISQIAFFSVFFSRHTKLWVDPHQTVKHLVNIVMYFFLLFYCIVDAWWWWCWWHQIDTMNGRMKAKNTFWQNEGFFFGINWYLVGSSVVPCLGNMCWCVCSFGFCINESFRFFFSCCKPTA